MLEKLTNGPQTPFPAKKNTFNIIILTSIFYKKKQ